MCCGRWRRGVRGRCCCSVGGRIRLCCCVWRRRRFVRRGFRVRCCMSIRARIFPRRSSFAIVAWVSSVSGCWSRACRTRSTKAAYAKKPDPAHHATASKPPPCSTRSPTARSTRRSAARRRGTRARQERIFSFRDDFGHWDPKAQRPRVVEPLQHQDPRRRARARIPAFQLDGARCLGVHPQRTPRGALDLLRATNATRLSPATACSTRLPRPARPSSPANGSPAPKWSATAPSAT